MGACGKTAPKIQDKGTKMASAQLKNVLWLSKLKRNVNEKCLFAQLHFDSLTLHQIAFYALFFYSVKSYNQSHTLSLRIQWPEAFRLVSTENSGVVVECARSLNSLHSQKHRFHPTNQREQNRHFLVNWH